MVKFISVIDYEFNKDDKLSSFELIEIKKAFNIIDSIVDMDTTSGALFHMWYILSDTIEFNEEKWYEEEYT